MPPYSPNDAALTVEHLESLRTTRGKALLDEIGAMLKRSLTLSVSDIAHLRRTYPAPSVHAGLTIAQIQPKARQKFPDLAADNQIIWAIPEALEQATDFAVARHKAARFAAAKAEHILDLCCGIGGDALALANIAPVTAIDLSAPRLACLRFNHEAHPTTQPIETICTDVTTPAKFEILRSSFPQALFHIDPARRSGGKRSSEFNDLIPGPDFLHRLIDEFRGGAIKLSPAVDFESLLPGHLEIISHNKTVVQAVLWVGKLARIFPPNTRTATMFTNHQRVTTYTPEEISDPPRFSGPEETVGGDLSPLWNHDPILYEIDPAFTRSALAHPLAKSLGLEVLTEDGGYLLDKSDRPPLDDPALTPFRMTSFLAYSEKNVIGALQNSSSTAPPGSVEVKTRGKIPGIDTDRLQVLFSKAVPHRQTVFIFRHGGGIYAAITTRIT